ncbi:MAG: GtrA family protein [Candidatus Omnitrophica bacterium]|nr:GtrA family protein [Candidatus Omnitrophota bacterium]
MTRKEEKTIMDGRKEFIRFLIAGVIVNATDFGIYFILFHYLPFIAAKAISFSCAGIVGYLMCKYGIFKRNQPSYSEIGRYAVVSIVALGVNVITNQGILVAMPEAVLGALVTATAVTGLFTFVCFKWWVFRPLVTRTETKD